MLTHIPKPDPSKHEIYMDVNRCKQTWRLFFANFSDWMNRTQVHSLSILIELCSPQWLCPFLPFQFWCCLFESVCTHHLDLSWLYLRTFFSPVQKCLSENCGILPLLMFHNTGSSECPWEFTSAFNSRPFFSLILPSHFSKMWTGQNWFHCSGQQRASQLQLLGWSQPPIWPYHFHLLAPR